ncbi:distal tail protein Dit [Halalkalibacter sp. APA_J-10(15)]|uniref:distal tail protein Dit n=1 Tax=Halalkalibacter sp. APA_J-10(15) TaxID=2933805 RepID=UPI001FF60A74|nr:distal tail protein Dit [Halalkalibacter sp. APA_J-10(15)]MCK0473776.1 phage tail family protein [Halalkalibacter sp. APA_J-10(15)]
MIFNGIEKEYIRVTSELFRPPTPPVEFLTTPKLTGGDRVRKKSFTSAELTVPITITGSKRIEERKEDLSTWLVHDQPKKLLFKDSPQRYYLALYHDMELEENYTFAKGHIRFYLPIACRFGEDKQIDIHSTFTSFPITGQIEVPWKSRTVFTNAESSFTFENDQGGMLRLNYGFIENDVLEIDYTKRGIRLNGENLAVALSLQSNWFLLKPGENTLRTSQPTTVTYTERFY